MLISEELDRYSHELIGFRGKLYMQEKELFLLLFITFQSFPIVSLVV